MNDYIVCAVDETDHGFAVARTADHLSRALGLRVALVHIAPRRIPTLVPVQVALPSTAALERSTGAEVAVLQEVEGDHAYARLQRIADEELLVEPELRHEVGDPATRILAVAEEVDARLIVVGSRGRGSLATVLLGSVSHDVVNGATCPVVVVPDASAPPAAWELDALSMS